MTVERKATTNKQKGETKPKYKYSHSDQIVQFTSG